MRVLSVDPSITRIGIAFIEDGQYVESHTFKTQETDRIEDRLLAITQHFHALLEQADFSVALIELPGTFVREGMFGPQNIGSLALLHMSIGTIVGSMSVWKLRVEFCKVAEWKGSDKKIVTQHQVRTLTGKKLNTHEADATMMGMRWMQMQRLRAAGLPEKGSRRPKFF